MASTSSSQSASSQNGQSNQGDAGAQSADTTLHPDKALVKPSAKPEPAAPNRHADDDTQYSAPGAE